MSVEQNLQKETEKWRERLADRMETITAVDAQGAELLENAQAYLTDVQHFKEQDDWIRAFEAVIWGWSWLEIGERLGKLEEK